MTLAKRKVLIVDDHPLFREGLKSLIARSANYETAGEAGSGSEAVRMARQIQPDLMTMDVSLPDMNGIEATRAIMDNVPRARVLMISMHPKFEYMTEAFRAGARGYVVKEATSARLVEAMDALCRGEFYLDGHASHEIVANLLAGGADRNTPAYDRAYDQLSPREQQVMRMVAEGLSTKEIASQLSLSPKTVENHRTNLMKKLNVHDRIELVRYAAKLGLIDVELWKQ